MWQDSLTHTPTTDHRQPNFLNSVLMLYIIYILYVRIAIMTKKSKKKAAKFGFRAAEGPRITTINIGTNITQQGTVCYF